MDKWQEKSLFVDYVPKVFCREFVDIRGHSSMLYNYMAVVLGVKPLIDDWIPVNKFDDFERICSQKYGLKVKAGSVWLYEVSDEYVRNLPGGKTLSTTKFLGLRYKKGMDKGSLHVFIAGTEDNLEAGYKSGWYPLIINDAVVQKPYIDFIRFGHALGYPQCCIEHFFKENPDGNFLWKIHSNDRNKLDLRCNSLSKDTSFSYIYHMPCSTSCRETIRYADNLRAEIKKHDPLYVQVIDRHLKAPFLVFSEQDIYAFEGTVSDDEILFEKSYFVGKPRYNLYNDDFRKADRIKVGDEEISVYKGQQLLKSIRKETPKNGFIVHFNQ